MGIKTYCKIGQITQDKVVMLDIPEGMLLTPDSTFQDYMYKMLKYGVVYMECTFENLKQLKAMVENKT